MSTPICIFEDQFYGQLFPLALTRPVFDLRCGVFTLKKKITRLFPKSSISLLCRNYLSEVVQEANPDCKVNRIDEKECLFFNGRVLAEQKLVQDLDLTRERIYVHKEQIIVAFLKDDNLKKMQSLPDGTFNLDELRDLETVEVDARIVEFPWDLVNENAGEIVRDFGALNQAGQILGQVDPGATLLNSEQICIGEASQVKAGAVLDADAGPILLGKGVTVMPNAVIQGPAFVGDGSTIKIGAKIYEGTAIGQVCKIGGEVEESIIHSYSNKQHEGFLGHAYLGSWTNLGADTNNSDLKNNYGFVKVFIDDRWVDSGCQFVGLFMGDHSKAGINTMFNTGTVVGVMSNVFGAGFPPKHIPSFAWGGSAGFVEHELEKALETARRVMVRRKVPMSPPSEKLFRHLFHITQGDRVEWRAR
ncbi:MAG: GlmU family protein [bacterium]